LKADEAQSHTFWFAHFLKPINGALLIAGGLLACVIPIHSGLSQADPLISIGIVSLAIFLPLSLYVYFEAKNIHKRFEEIFSIDNESLGNLFVGKEEYESFIQISRNRIVSRHEYYFSFLVSFGIILPSGYILDLVRRTTTVDSYIQAFQRTPLLINVENAYVVLYWTFIESILLSVVWVILGITVALYNLGKEKPHLVVTRSNRQLMKKIQESKERGMSALRLDSADFSFGRLKCGLLPMADFVFILSLKIALVGFFVSIPAILNYVLSPLRYSALIWYGLCSFIALLSLMVFIIAELGTYRIWNSAKDETLVLLEQLSDKVKFECIKSIFSSDEVETDTTEHHERDANFIRSVIDDLRKLECTHFTLSSVAKLLGAVLLPFVPLIIYKLLGL
jgi:hypothetical protein